MRHTPGGVQTARLRKHTWKHTHLLLGPVALLHKSTKHHKLMGRGGEDGRTQGEEGEGGMSDGSLEDDDPQLPSRAG